MMDDRVEYTQARIDEQRVVAKKTMAVARAVFLGRCSRRSSAWGERDTSRQLDATFPRRTCQRVVEGINMQRDHGTIQYSRPADHASRPRAMILDSPRTCEPVAGVFSRRRERADLTAPWGSSDQLRTWSVGGDRKP